MIIENCPNCGREETCFYNKSWRFECDDGLPGIKINYCPFCGFKLEGRDIKK